MKNMLTRSSFTGRRVIVVVMMECDERRMSDVIRSRDGRRTYMASSMDTSYSLKLIDSYSILPLGIRITDAHKLC